MLLEILKIAAVGAIGLSLFLYFYQDRMLFYPPGAPANLPRPARGAVEELSLVTAEGTRVVSWLVRGRARAPLVIYFGGNAEDVSWLIGMDRHFAGYSVLLVNYRGYGPSEGSPGESALFADALAWYDLAAGRPDIDARSIVAMGRSLGSGVAVHLAASREVAGVILVSPYDSVRSLAKSIYPFLPVGLLLKHPFDSMSRAGAIGAPLLCLAADNDRVVPPTHSRRLFDVWAGTNKVWRVLRSDHDGISSEPEYWRAIAEFLTGLQSGRSGPGEDRVAG
ncbi:MAG: alpha/beta hydrolase [Betaproteobacteria bacterium]|nr:alpha/beta hydrolase [Betaproteobacteria bacterium]